MIDSAMNRRRFLLTTAAAGCLPFWHPKAAVAQESGTLRMRLIEEVQILDPAFRTAESELWVSDQVLPKLINFKAGSAWEWELYCAESLEQIDDVTISFTLKKGLQWSSGYGEVTAEDVKFSFERFKDAALGATNAPLWDPLDNVEVTGSHSGIIHMTQPYSGLFGYVLPYDGGQIVCKKAVEEAGGRMGADVLVTCGPFRVAEMRPGQGVVLEPDENWIGDKPAFSRIEMLPITDSKAAENAILAGDLDWGFIAISSVPDLSGTLPENLTMERLETNNFTWFCANMENPDLQDDRVRKAIQMAVDRSMIIDGAYFGVVEPSYGLATKGLPGYVDAPAVGFDPAEARALIDEAGAAGLTLRLDVVAETDKITAAQIIQANLAAIGVMVDINQHEAGAFWSLSSVLGKDMQLFISDWISVPPDVTWAMQWLLPEQAGIWNWQYFIDEDYARLFDAASQELDPVKQDGLLKQAQARIDASYTTMVISHLPRFVLYNNERVVPAMKPNGHYRLEQFSMPA